MAPEFLQANSGETIAAPALSVWSNVTAFVAGLALGGVLWFLLRGWLRKAEFRGFPHRLVAIDAGLVVCVTILTSVFELWKASTWKELTWPGSFSYTAVGLFIALGIGGKWLLSEAKELSKKAFDQLEATCNETRKESDRQRVIEDLAREAMTEKLKRLQEEYVRPTPPPKSVATALDPDRQLLILIKVLHGWLKRHVKPPSRLRIGVYGLGEDNLTLEPLFSWDGSRNNVFGGNHKERMKLSSAADSSPHGGKSVVVQVWQQSDPFVIVADTDAASREGKFYFFREEHRQTLKSMIAYKHLLSGPLRNEAFVLTLDSDQAGLFSADVEKECRLLLPAFSVRIELELLASYLSNPSSE